MACAERSEPHGGGSVDKDLVPLLSGPVYTPWRLTVSGHGTRAGAAMRAFLLGEQARGRAVEGPAVA